MLNILIASPCALCTPHFETELEIAQRALGEGYTVTYLCCDSSLPTCEFNYFHDEFRCDLCVRMRRDGLRLLSPEVVELPLLMLNEDDLDLVQKLKKTFSDINELRSYFIDNFDIGWGVLSTLTGLLREPVPDLQDPRNKNMVENTLIAAAQVYLSLLNHFKAANFDEVYFFNGRFASLRAVMRACERVGITFFAHERGSDKDHYQLFCNALPHDVSHASLLIRKAWDNGAQNGDRDNIASKFFMESRNGVSLSWYSFTTTQTRGLLPPGWDSKKNNLAIFVSSEDEFVAINERWLNPIYLDQNQGIKQIIESLTGKRDFHIYLRVHPNLKGLTNSQTRFLYSLKAENLTVIEADSPISSYSLLEAASKVITFGSTMGIEATFWSKPSILAGRSLYEELDATYNPESHDELMRLIHSELPPKPKLGALMYGYYFVTRGDTFMHFHATGFYSGSFFSKNDGKFHVLSPEARPIRSRLRVSYFKRQFSKVTAQLLKFLKK